MFLAGGIMGQGYQCGQLWGAVLAAGARAFQLFGAGPQAETAAVVAAQRLVRLFNAKYKNINCLELTGADIKVPKQALKYLAKGGPIRCFSMTAGYASAAYREINTIFSAPPPEPASTPPSCAALLVRKMGASEIRAVMAAGLAGGLGLSGGGCGALGAAIWLAGLRNDQEASGLPYDNPQATAVIEKFLQASDYEFECAKITAGKFSDVYAHAEYLRTGGCATILSALSTPG